MPSWLQPASTHACITVQIASSSACTSASVRHDFSLASITALTGSPCAVQCASSSSPVVKGSATEVADVLEDWFRGGACDGFVLTFPVVPLGLQNFVDLVVPELQRRGLFRREYEGTTLRDHLGLARPVNPHFA